MKKILLSIGFLLSLNAFSQNVGINSTGAAPVTSAALDVDMANKGILIPRVALTTTTAFAPVTGTATASLLVYNNATAGTYPTNVTPGYYYWSGTAWVRLINSGTDWELLGNQGTTMGTNFLGTIDNVGLDLRTNNTLRQRILSSGEVVVNNTTAFSGDMLSGYATGTQSALNGYLGGTGAGYAGYISNSSTGASTSLYVANTSTNAGSAMLMASSNSNAAFNVYAVNSSTTNTRPAYSGILGTTTGNGIAVYVGGVSFVTYTGGAGGTFSHPTTGLYGIARNTTLSTGGIFAGNGATPTTLANGTGASSIGTTSGFVALATTAANSVGAYISGNNAAWVGPASGGAGVAATGTAIGTFSTATSSGNNFWGGYFGNGNANGYAYVGGRTGGTDYKINGPGTVATMVDDLSGQKVNMFCPEAPEILFQDYGTAQLVNGTMHVTIDPFLTKNIFVDAAHPMKVFVQLEGDCKGVYVTNKTANGFDVVELQGGTSSTQFSWSIVANRIDTKLPDGSLDSKFQDVRFPASPLKIEAVQQQRTTATPSEEQSLPSTGKLPVKQ